MLVTNGFFVRRSPMCLYALISPACIYYSSKREWERQGKHWSLHGEISLLLQGWYKKLKQEVQNYTRKPAHYSHADKHYKFLHNMVDLVMRGLKHAYCWEKFWKISGRGWKLNTMLGHVKNSRESLKRWHKLKRWAFFPTENSIVEWLAMPIPYEKSTLVYHKDHAWGPTSWWKLEKVVCVVPPDSMIFVWNALFGYPPILYGLLANENVFRIS